MKYIPTIGIECHVQLATKTKLFSGADNDAREQEPNSVVSPIDYGLPGMLPVLNRGAVELAIKAGLALGCKIAHISRFDRKHYFYPDLPNGYQITQLYQPIVLEGLVSVPLPSGDTFNVRVQRAHLEADAGKLTHYADYSLVDLNRVGTPLIEIISEPDMHSAEQAKLYAQELYLLMSYAGVTHGDLYHGNMRFDVNISAAKEDDSELGKRTEVKNLNSFRAVASVVEFEYKRQTELLEKGKTVEQETRGWDEAKQKTFSQRSKEDAPDYRYMPDPDLPPIVLKQEQIDKIKKGLPALPNVYRKAWSNMKLDVSVINTLLSNQKIANLIKDIQDGSNDTLARMAAHWFASSYTASVQQGVTPLVLSKDINLEKAKYIELAQMVVDNELNSNVAITIFKIIVKKDNKKTPREIAEEKNLLQVSDEDEIIKIVEQVLTNLNAKQAIADIKAGNDKAIGFLVGQVMEQSGGKANPTLAQKLIRERL